MTDIQTNNNIPISKKELEILGWDYVDVILVSGDAYIDHPSFGTAVIARVIENLGLRVAVVAQPNWQDDLRDFRKLGTPRLFFGVNAGNMDSMVNHYTANKRMRSDDAYTPGGRAGARPDNASITYTKILKTLYPDVPVVLGGVEASMRRFAHYDYWTDSLHKSILIDSGADILSYGMGEKTITNIIRFAMLYGREALLNNSVYRSMLADIKQIAYLADNVDAIGDEYIRLHSFEKLKHDKKAYAENFKIIESESNKYYAKTLVEENDEGFVVVTPPNEPPTTDEIDEIYDLPYTRMPHPKYAKKGEIPAFTMIQNSINIHRGCFGGCAFCTISTHQGKYISSRSVKSVVAEAEKLVQMPYFKGTISDLGGPSANMYMMRGKNFDLCKRCSRHSCITPEMCPNLNFDHTPLLELYAAVAKVKGVKNIYIGSGIRFDMFFPKNNETAVKNKVYEYAQELIVHHTGGRLKVAPEHCSDNVLQLMRKPDFSKFLKFKQIFDNICRKNNIRRQLIPYFISSHPGCDVKDMAELAVATKQMKYRPEQVQTFTPTPMTLSTTMFYTGINPYTNKEIFSAYTVEAKKLQNLFLFWYLPENRTTIINILRRTGNAKYIEMLYGKT